MKILIFNSFYYPNIFGGAEISIKLLAEAFALERMEPVVVTISNADRIDSVNKVKVYNLHHRNIYWYADSKKKSKIYKPFWYLINLFNPGLYYRISRIIDMEKPDIINTQNLIGFPVFIWRMFKRKKVPVVHTVRDYFLICWRSSMFRRGNNCLNQCISCKLYSYLYKLNSRNVDAVVGISDHILKKHLRFDFFCRSRRYVIGNPVICDPKIKPGKHNKKKLVFGFVGAITKEKGIELVLDVFLKFFKDIHLNIYGRSQDRLYMEDLKDKYISDNIKFMGFKKQEEIYNEIDVLVVPSLWDEPFGRVIIEANSYGIPVIASNRGGIPEIIEDNRNGFIFDPDNTSELIDVIKRISSYPGITEKMSDDCIGMAKQYSANKISSDYIEIYNDIINNYKK